MVHRQAASGTDVRAAAWLKAGLDPTFIRVASRGVIKVVRSFMDTEFEDL